MKDSLYIAFRYISYYRMRTVILVACVSLVAVLPLALEQLVDESEQQLLSRAETTPLVIGSKGSELDLVMNTLYFDQQMPEPITMGETIKVMDSGLAVAIPVYARFSARGSRVVGTSIDYFEQRGLRIAAGRNFALLGEAVLGADVSKKLGLRVGDTIVSAPENVFDLAGVYPLKMNIVGVFEKSHSPDDLAVFVDVKTAWIIQGLGHGHQDLNTVEDKSVLFATEDGSLAANAKLYHYTEITEDTAASFHFHGDAAGYPLSAVIAVPFDEKSATILRGRYLDKDVSEQAVQPSSVIGGLLANIFRMRAVLDGVIGIVAVATVLALILVFSLSLKLRSAEFETATKLGCSRFTAASLVGSEIAIIALLSMGVCAGALLLFQFWVPTLVRQLLIG